MENNEATIAQPPEKKDPLPGELLRKVRTERNLSLEQVADDLCLTPRQVEAMEKGDYGYLPGATYARGYLRNYARLLGIAEHKISTPNLIPTTPRSPISTRRPSVSVKESTGGKSVPLLSMVIVAILLGLIYSWWQSRETPEFTPRPVEAELAENNVSSIDQQIIEQPVPDVAVEMPAESELPVPSSDDVIPPENDENPVEQSTESVNAGETPQDEITVSSADGSNLVLTFSADSWVDIRDSSDKNLIRRTVTGGETKIFEGTPPFKVFLGFAKGVKVNYRGEEYDVASHINGAIARFTLK